MSELTDLAKRTADQRAGVTGNVRTYTNKDLKSDKSSASLAGLYNAADEAQRQEAAYLADKSAGRLDEQKDMPLMLAKKTLADTQGTSDSLRLAGKVGEDTAAAMKPQRSWPDRILGSAFEPSWGGISPVDAASTVGGLMADPAVAIPADAYMGMDAARNLVQNGVQGFKDHPIMSSLQALTAASGPLRLAKFNKGATAVEEGVSALAKGRPFQKVGAGRGVVPGSEFADKQSGIPAVRHYWDALDLGQEPGQAVKIAAGRDKGAKGALEALQRAGRGSEEAARSVPVTQAPWRATPDEVLRDARSVPSDPRAAFGDAHMAPGIDANTVRDAEGTALGHRDKYDPAQMVAHPGAQAFIAREAAVNGPLVEKLTSTWGNRRTGRSAEEIAAQLSSKDPLAWKPDMVDLPNGSTVPSNGNGGTPHPGAGMDNASLRALRDAAQARYAAQVADVPPTIPNNLHLPTPEEALIEGDEASKRSVMFGGAGSKQSGSHTRPSKRSPIGKGKK